ncbi:SDR family NAD(P)-dependent oxidoreductase [Microbacterium sp. No. 7]|uniref:SDR family NAD(P)-dependent oxidoreductase n=1 Tax=Microbacterium sp. No. 7 TaxID=1714373 RepID=UPI0006ED2D34|nr:SDR family NAD(P)-dependent oxidoreductase [Microbacterium sp. No. 7]ALJ21962.1 hypothetical protein AOA12_19515 [Microbacterium sp. No. 7]
MSTSAPEYISLSLEGRTALVTAAGSGMGKAIALLFAAQGAHVIAADLNPEAVAATVDEIAAAGGSAEAHTADLSSPPAVEAFAEAILATHTVIDVLHNHAGIRGPGGFDYDQASWDAAMTLNLWAPMLLTQRFLPLLRASSSASIIFTASTAGLKAVPNLPVYSATKAGVIQYMKSIAVLLGPEGIRANAICPGATDTAGMRRNNDDAVIQAVINHVPLRRMGQAEDDAALALFLASDASRYITGVAIPVDGGAIV